MARLGDICKINMGQSPDSSTYNDHGIGLPFYQGNADFGEEYPSAKVYCSSPVKVAQKGDILISVRAPIGALNMANEKCCIGRGLAAITANEDVCDRQYLWYVLLSKVEELNAKGTGSTFKAINRNILDETEIPLIPIDDQKQISDQLDKVVSLISLRKKQLQKLDDLVKSRFVEMFGDCRTNPKGWDTVALGDIATVGSSKRVFVEELQESGIPFYRGTEVGALAEGQAITPELYITEEHYKALIDATGKPEIGDLLMPSICSDGRIWVVNTEEPFYFKDGRVLWVHAINEKYDPFFLLYTLKDRIMTDYGSIASGTTFAELKIFALKQCHIFDVPMDEQKSFAAFISQVDKSKLAIQQSLNRLEQMKQALMQKYFG